MENIYYENMAMSVLVTNSECAYGEYRNVTFPDFSGILDFQCYGILLEMNRSPSQLSVAL